MKRGSALFLLVLAVFAQDIFRTKLSGIGVDDASSWYFTQFTTTTVGEYVYLNADPVGAPPPIPILRTKLKETAVQGFNFNGDTLVAFTTSGPDINGWVYLRAVLKNGGQQDVIRTKLKDTAVQAFTAPPGNWINGFATRTDGEWVYLRAVHNPVGIEERKTPDSESEIDKFVFGLNDIFPNPIRNRAQISYSLAEPSKVNLAVYDASGRLVKTLVNSQKQQPGITRLTWACTDDKGRKLSSGVYFLKFNAGTFQATKRVLLIKY